MNKKQKKGKPDFLKFRINLLLLILLIITIFFAVHVFFPLEIISTIFDNFNKVAIGIAALITAYFGSSYLTEEVTRKRHIDYYRKRYPPQNYPTKFKIIVSEEDPNTVYLLDLEGLKKHHIWNMKTMYDLAWQNYKREKLPKEEFLSYLDGDPIRTRGDLGE